MRVPTAAATALASVALLSTAWHLGGAPALTTAPARPAVVVPAAPPTSGPVPTEPVPTEPVPTEPVAAGPDAASTPTAPPPPPAPAPPVTADGAVVPTRFGDVQVQVVVQDGVLLDVVALQLTDVDGTSRRISEGAAPVLRRQALDAQSAVVDSVSSATYTSEAYAQSLQSALDAAAQVTGGGVGSRS